jgi:hypothetical protein
MRRMRSCAIAADAAVSVSGGHDEHHRRPRGRIAKASASAVALLAAGSAVAGGLWKGASPPSRDVHAGPQGDGTAITPVGWYVDPAGRQTRLGNLPTAEALSPNGRWLAVMNAGDAVQSLQVVETADGDVVQTLRFPTPEALFAGLAWSPHGQRLYASAGGNNKIRVLRLVDGRLTERRPLRIPTTEEMTDPYPAGIAVSPSQYWKSTAIFVVEDDAQNGPDHVDAHRTVAEVISPYTQTGRVDSTFYSTVSMLRTIELLVGIGPMTQLDATATPMLNAFVPQPVLTPYNAVKPRSVSPIRYNATDAPLAAASSRQDLSREDQINELVFNRAIWKSVNGLYSHMPAPHHSVMPLSGGGDDD